MSFTPFSMLGGSGETDSFPPGPPSKENVTHGIKKLLLKTQVNEDFVP